MMAAGRGAEEVAVSRFWFVPAALALAAVLGAAPALAANKDIERLQVQVAALQTQVTNLERLAEDSLRELRRLNEALAESNAAARKAVQDRRLQDESVATSLREMSERLSEIGEQVQSAQNSRDLPPAV